jgi:hypothetical protein
MALSSRSGTRRHWRERGPEGALRYSVTARLAGKVFEQLKLDINHTTKDPRPVEIVEVKRNPFAFIGEAPLKLPMISPSQQLAEKLHAYTRRYAAGTSSRPRDLFDMFVIVQEVALPTSGKIAAACRQTFEMRKTPWPPSSTRRPRTGRIPGSASSPTIPFLGRRRREVTKRSQTSGCRYWRIASIGPSGGTLKPGHGSTRLKTLDELPGHPSAKRYLHSWLLWRRPGCPRSRARGAIDVDETDNGSGEFQGDLNRSLGDLLRELQESRREIARLRAENHELGSKLGLRLSSPAERTAAPSSFTAHSSTDVHSSLEHKIALIRSLFRGREDVYAVRWTSTKTGKTGYSPAVRGGWAAAKNRPKSFLPLTNEVLESHLTGEMPIGIYPLLRDDTCRFLACDFDGDGWALDAGSLLAAAKRHDVAAYLERSRSGAGGHVWIFMTAPVPAVAARRLATGLLREAMVERGEIDLDSYDRFFPNQDFLPKGSFGNLIALPLDGRAREQENTEFIDPSTLEPYRDQWGFLEEVDRLSPKVLDQALASLPPVKVGPDALKVQIRSTRDRLPAPDTVPCTQRAMLSVEKPGFHLGSCPTSSTSRLSTTHSSTSISAFGFRRSRFRGSSAATTRTSPTYISRADCSKNSRN